MVDKDEQSSFDPQFSVEEHKTGSNRGDYNTRENSVGTHLIPSNLSSESGKRVSSAKRRGQVTDTYKQSSKAIKKGSPIGAPEMDQSDCDLERDLESSQQPQQMEFAPRNHDNKLLSIE